MVVLLLLLLLLLSVLNLWKLLLPFWLSTAVMLILIILIIVAQSSFNLTEAPRRYGTPWVMAFSGCVRIYFWSVRCKAREHVAGNFAVDNEEEGRDWAVKQVLINILFCCGRVLFQYNNALLFASTPNFHPPLGPRLRNKKKKKKKTALTINGIVYLIVIFILWPGFALFNFLYISSKMQHMAFSTCNLGWCVV